MTSDAYFEQLFRQCGAGLDMTLIVEPGMRSNVLNYVSYDEYTGTRTVDRGNTNVADARSLARLSKLGSYPIY